MKDGEEDGQESPRLAGVTFAGDWRGNVICWTGSMYKLGKCLITVNSALANAVWPLLLQHHWKTRVGEKSLKMDAIEIAMEDQEDIAHRNAIRASGWQPPTESAKPMEEIACKEYRDA